MNWPLDPSSNRSLQKMPQYIVILSMLYVVTFIFPIMMAYRMVQLGPFLTPGGTLIFPASYFFGDIIAEVYGYKVARQLLWSALICQMFLSIVVVAVLKTPYPTYWQQEPAFELVLGNALRYAIASSIGNFFGEFCNIYLISKFKILLSGKYFWMRSLGSTLVGEAVLTSVVFFITFHGLASGKHMALLIVSGYLYKMAFAVIAVVPASLAVAFLKKKEGVDVFDYDTNFNPFKFNLDFDK